MENLQVDEDAQYLQIHQRFAVSEFGRQLVGSPRFDRYRPVQVTEKEWISLLGPDVDNLEHHTFTFHLTCDYLAACDGQYTPQEGAKLKHAAIIHDWGEAIVTDINLLFKTPEDEQAERAAHRLIYGKLHGNWQEYEELTDIIFATNTKLGKAFNIIERLGYMTTALKAFEISQITDDKHLATNLKQLCASVFGRNYQYLIDLCHESPAVVSFINANRQTLNLAFETLPPESLAENFRKP